MTRRTARCQEPWAHLAVLPCGYTSGFVEDTRHDENGGEQEATVLSDQMMEELLKNGLSTNCIYLRLECTMTSNVLHHAPWPDHTQARKARTYRRERSPETFECGATPVSNVYKCIPDKANNPFQRNS